MGVGRAHGKLLLFGEHAAVYGHPAVGVGLPYETTVWTEPAGPGRRISGVPDEFVGAVRGLLDHIRTSDRLPAVPADLSIRIASNLPPEAGLGSSAALCAALTEALFAPQTAEAGTTGARCATERMRPAHEAERYFHGTPSGIDTSLAISGGIQAIFPRPPELPTTRALNAGSRGFAIVVGAIRRTAGTKELVSRVRSEVESGNEETKHSLARLGEIATEAIRAFDTEDEGLASRLGDLAAGAQVVLGELGLVIPAVEDVIRFGEVHGAAGGKMSGAGGGGAFFLVFSDPETALQCRDDLRAYFADRLIPGVIHDAFRIRGAEVLTLG